MAATSLLEYSLVKSSKRRRVFEKNEPASPNETASGENNWFMTGRIRLIAPAKITEFKNTQNRKTEK
jgi:hypothetical protein